MNGYRRVEPAFCRGCGIPWTAGADACPGCGESITAVPPKPQDPHALPKFKAVVIVGGLVFAARWLGLVPALSVVSSAESLWMLTLGLPTVLAVLTAPRWFPKLDSAPWWRGAPAGAWVVAGLALVPIACVDVLVHFAPDFAFRSLGSAATFSSHGWGWLGMGLVLGGVVFEELLFRGLVFDGIRPIGGSTHAAIASALWPALLTLSPASALAGIVSAGLRARTRSLLPSLLMRIGAVLLGGGMGWLSSQPI